jgi:hypothetical protein
VPRFYAGVGSRRTPHDVLATMRDLGHALALAGFTLRSGAAIGADAAFEQGAIRGRGEAEIYLPWRGYNNHWSPLIQTTHQARKLAATLHPGWDKLQGGARAMHARNCHQVLGFNLDVPVEAVICWTPDGCEGATSRNSDTGGTATAIVLAERCGIPVFNLQRDDARQRLLGWLGVI